MDVLLLTPFLALISGEPSRADHPVRFALDVRPILSRHCFNCHGPADSSRQAGLRLDAENGPGKVLESGNVAVVPGRRDQSTLFARITSSDENQRMPPAETGKHLTAEEIDVIGQWIDQGAVYSAHWSFVPPALPAFPALQGHGDWVRSPIDVLIVDALSAKQLAPSPEAPRETLIRRLSLDLRGIPPTLEEVDRFLADGSPDAYDRLVDRILADPAFGERWAYLWLDLARYADSMGYGSDPLRIIWRYRDWVISAFNRNLTYDQFTLEQLAGDLLANRTDEQLLATAFHRNTKTNTEGGTDDEEFRTEAVRDRVDTTMQVWMGLTMGCAKCHSHKYDPISQTEYYQFYAWFNQTADRDLPDESPTMPAPTVEMVESHQKIDSQIAQLRQRLETPSLELAEGQRGWEARFAAGRPLFEQPPRVLREPAGTGSAVARRLLLPSEILAIIDTPTERRLPAQSARLARHYRSIAPSLDALRRQIAQLEASKPAYPVIPVMRELPVAEHRTTHLLVKGNFLQKGDSVAPAMPSAFHPMPADAPPNRIGVARWLVSPENPLTARVAVNRVWGQFFGTGLVETEEDFGSQGMLPTHPGLLDWLAAEYIRLGWDQKRLLRRIVTSAAYRQSSAVTPEQLAKDPLNRLLGRGPRYRLPAEQVRDQALALSGLLSRKQFGPSVYPPQPEGLWQAAFNGQRTWPTSQGEDRYRRALYVFWRRTIPYPSMATFDAPSREIACIRRPKTNTPLQAFVTLNDPVYVEAAQALARRIAKVGGTSTRERAEYGLRLCLLRHPDSAQVDVVCRLHARELERFQADADSARALATEPLGPVGEGQDVADLAAWTVVANVLLNLDAVLTKN